MLLVRPASGPPARCGAFGFSAVGKRHATPFVPSHLILFRRNAILVRTEKHFTRFHPLGRLAQLVRAPVLHTGGHRFEPCIAHHLIPFLLPSSRFALSLVVASESPQLHRFAVFAIGARAPEPTERYACAGLPMKVFATRRNERFLPRCSSMGYGDIASRWGKFRLRPDHAVSPAPSNKLIARRGQHRSQPRKDFPCPQEI